MTIQDNTLNESGANTNTTDQTNTTPPEVTLYGKTGGDETPPKTEPEGEGTKEPEVKKGGLGEDTEPEGETDPNKEYFGKPEKYDYSELKLPEGMQLHQESTEKINEFISKFDMSQKGANELMALAVEHTKQVQTQLEQAIAQAQEQKIASYKEALKTDKEIGGAKLKENLQIANVAYDKFGNDKFKALIEENGLISHPEFVKVFHSIGKLVQNDTIHNSTTPPVEKRTPAQVLYERKNKE